MRARDVPGLTLRGQPGPQNAITDVEGVRVGHATVVRGDDVRTGVTVIEPGAVPAWRAPLFAGCHTLNGNGELTGLEWVRESGTLTSTIALTNTHSVGVVRDALVRAQARDRHPAELWWSTPVVGETWDGMLNDVAGQHVTAEHVDEALAAAGKVVSEGNVGGGTGMICHGFKGGIGTSSRVTEEGWTLGVLVQANHGRRPRLAVDGVPVGKALGADRVPLPPWPDEDDDGSGSIIPPVA